MLLTLATRSTRRIAVTALLVFVFCFVAYAAGNEVDLTFNPAPTNDLANVTDGNLAIQPDGKIIIFGAFQVVNGVPKLKIARLNPDGTLDTSFNFNPTVFATINSVVVQADGKILVAGSASSFGPKVLRLNSDGSVDGAFLATLTGQQVYAASVNAVQPDGKVYVATHGSGVHFSYTALYRLNADGSTDGTFTPVGFDGWLPKHYLKDVIVLSSGKILVSGSHTYGYVFRLNSDGSKDASFESPLLSTPLSTGVANSIALQSDGKVLFTGEFNTVNGLSRSGLQRLNSDGTLDMQFPQSGYNSTRVRVLANDKIMVGAKLRLNSDGTFDNTFNPPSALGVVGNWLIDGLQRIVLFGGITEAGDLEFKYARLGNDGSFDATFAATARLIGTVELMAIQADNKVIVSGDFTRMNGVLRKSFARLNPDGTLDPTFDGGTGFDSPPRSIVVLGNGQILVGGLFNTYNGAMQPRFARLNSNGSLDASFNPVIDNTVFAIGLQADGKILIGGSFTNVNSVNQKGLARLNSNGTLDAAFAPLFATVTINSIVVQSNDKIIFGGTFSGVSGVARSNIARLNPDGSVDTTFNAGTIFQVSSIIVQPDGKYLLVVGYNVMRLNTDGSTDNTFQQTVISGDFAVINGLLLQSDGSIVMGGTFFTVNGTSRSNLVRLTSTGALETAFIPAGTNASVKTLAAQPGGKVLLGGSFTLVDNIVRAGIARLNTVPFQTFVRAVDFDFDGDSKADVSVYRPSNNYWYISRSSDSQFTFHHFGTAGDIAAPGDYDGDGKFDLGIFRPSTGDWWYQSSINGAFVGLHWGGNGDIPRPSDIDGDGRTDYVIYRPSEGNWYRLTSGGGVFSQKYFGAVGDKPLIGDFDGDGKDDPAIFRPSTGVFWYMSSIDSVHRAIQWGIGSDIPVPADYDGDGKTDAAVYRPSNGYWYVRSGPGGPATYTQFGIAEDRPVPADYDGDGKADIAVYRPSTGTWYMLRSTAGFSAQQFGNSTDVPTPNTFIP